MEITKQFIEQISTMSTEELRKVHSAIVGQINYRKSMDMQRAKSQLYVGANCKVNHPKAYGKTFIVQKINPKNVICTEAGKPGSKWTITASMLEVIG
jgi:hypothetical protein